MRPSSITRVLSRHRLLALVIVLVAVLTSLGVWVLSGGDRGSTALDPGDEPTPNTTQTAEGSHTPGPTAPGSTLSPIAEGSPRVTDEARPSIALGGIRDTSPRLVLWFERWAIGVGPPYPWPPSLTVLDDGRVVTHAEDSDAGNLHLVVRRLTPAGLARVDEEVRGTGLFEASANYESGSLSDAELLGSGGSFTQFTYGHPPNQVVVRWSTPGPAVESPVELTSEVKRLTELSALLLTLESWLPGDAWIEPEPLPYLAGEFIIRIQPGFMDLEPGAAFLPLREWVEMFHGTWNRQLHCGVIAFDEASAIAAELDAAGQRNVGGRAISGLDRGVWTHLRAQEEPGVFELVIVPLTADGVPACW
jgi:hypothetical protein